ATSPRRSASSVGPPSPAVPARVPRHPRPGAPGEIVNLRAAHRYPLPRPRAAAQPAAEGSAVAARKGTRRAWFGSAWHDTPLYERGRLPAGAPLPGPAIVEQADTTTVRPPGRARPRRPAWDPPLRTRS